MREDVPSLVLEPLNANITADATLRVMKAEYAFFHSHLQWHQYNCELMGQQPIIKIQDVFSRWESIYQKVFKNYSSLSPRYSPCP
ncbi:MAG: hypothetical protein PHE86_02190 [Candidatus Marinimicrobia bacterium]|nr:hypothetical protein [Candidatus Neomarinimicrobiota bacterium]MDD5583015.1 hypothetical protein [Candidatus Neomarinimicrobiota bacterium]